MEIIHDYEDNWWQSDVYKDWDRVIKKYLWITEFQAVTYVHIQSLLNEKEVELDIEPPIMIQNDEIKWINVSFSFIDIESIAKEKGVVTISWDFIDWNTLNSLLTSWYINKEDIYSINILKNTINEHLETSFGFDMSTWYIWNQTHTLNIKVLRYDPKSKKLILVVTDIACEIADFIDNNLALINQLLKSYK
jgi:hypothetical protein